MTDRKEALEALLAQVKDGNVGHNGFCPLWHTDGLCMEAENACAGSLDAALALHEAVLPRQGWEVFKICEYPGMIPGLSPFKFGARVGYGTTFSGDSDNPARAWLLAIIRALIAGEEA